MKKRSKLKPRLAELPLQTSPLGKTDGLSHSESAADGIFTPLPRVGKQLVTRALEFLGTKRRENTGTA